MRIATHPSGATLRFESESHSYLFGTESFKSVTTLIKAYFPQFDAVTVASRKAEREGLTAADLIASWEKKKELASAFGSKIHSFAEALLAGEPVDHLALEIREQAFLHSLKEAIARITKFYEVVEVEKIVFSPKRKLAGTIDLLLRNRETGEYVVADWKTNREIKLKSYGDETGLSHCVHLPNCNHIHYSLQLYAYRELLLSEGYLPQGARVRGILLHLKEGVPKVLCNFIQPRMLEDEVRALFAAVDA